MSLDPRFVLAPSLEMYFVDKDTGLPLSGGIVTFYSDENRTQLKPVYEISGTPPNYTYTALPNPIILSQYGTFQDNSGNNILPYYFPYDGTPDDSTGAIELYYVVVKSSTNVSQFTREGWPNTSASGPVPSNTNMINYIANGQFLLHNNNPPAAYEFNYGIYTNNVLSIAQGGWTWEVDTTSTSVDTITYTLLTSFVDPPPDASPRYEININRSSASADAISDLRITFPDVNKFGSVTGQSYTFLLTGSATDTVDYTIFLVKYFGTGGSSSGQNTTETQIGIGSLNTTTAQNAITFTFGDNLGDVISPNGNNDDFVQIAVRFPPSNNFNVKMTDLILTPGMVPATSTFPQTPNADFIIDSTVGYLPIPDPKGFDLYLTIKLTPSGMIFDDSEICKVLPTFEVVTAISTMTNELWCNGDMYKTSEYSPIGIPYARLQKKLWVPSFNIPRFGTGLGFVTTYTQEGVTHNILFTTNNFGSIAAIPDPVSSGFTITTVHSISSSGYGYISYIHSSNAFYIFLTRGGDNIVSANAGTSGFTITTLKNNTIPEGKPTFDISTIAANLITPGSYFTFNPTDISLNGFYVWFTIDGSGSDPSPGGTGIPVALRSTDTAADVAKIVNWVINGGQQNIITTIAGSAVTGGTYFTFSSTNSTSYYVWYKKDGVGVDPSLGGGKIGIEVDVLGSDLSAQVAIKTIQAINSTYYAVPNLKGMTLRGYDPGEIWDLYATEFRFGSVYGNQLGTFELDQFYSHNHTGSYIPGLDGAGGNAEVIRTGVSDPSDFPVHVTMTYNGGPETRGYNAAVNFVIKY